MSERWRLDVGVGEIRDQDDELVARMPATCVTWEWERRAALLISAPVLSLALRGAPRPLSRHATTEESRLWAEAYERWFYGSRASALPSPEKESE